MGSASKTSICNLALSRVRTDTIDDYDDDTSKAANRCRIHYPVMRKTVLEAHNWNFAKAVKALALPSGEESFEFNYRYDYPVDCVKARYIVHPDELRGGASNGIILSNKTMGEPIEFDIYSSDDGDRRFLDCNIEEAHLAYTKDIEDTRMFSALFEDALAWKLATELAIPFGGDSGQRYRREAMAAYREVINEARALSANERQRPINLYPRSIQARQGVIQSHYVRNDAFYRRY